MVSTHLEVEAKFAVDGNVTVPDLTALPLVESVASTREQHLSAIYYDTKDLRLTRAKATLRRRTGGADDGWHVKLKSDEGRLELAAPLEDPEGGEYTVPEELLAQVRSIVREYPLVPVAQVDNHRTESLLADATGHPVAEFCDDRVTAWSLLPGGEQTQWREWEVELAGALPGTAEGTELLSGATTKLISVGARKSASPSKLVAALGKSLVEAPLPDYLAAEREPDSPAAAVVAALQANRDKLVAYDPKVRRDEWDSVHQMRVATRELRSHLQTFDGVLAGERVERVLAELKVLAGMLGVARDAEVVEERFLWLLDSDDSGVISTEDREHILATIGEEYRRAHRRIVAGLNSQRYLTLLDDLDALLANPPVVEPAEDDQPQQMDEVMAEHLDQAYEKLRKRHKKAVRNWSNPELTLHEREEYFHDMRKSAKKLRYAAEAVSSATGLKTRRIYKACKQMQEVLGDFQDAVTSRDKLRAMAATDARRHRDTFALGLLWQREREIGLQALDDYDTAYRKITAAYRRLRKS